MALLGQVMSNEVVRSLMLDPRVAADEKKALLDQHLASGLSSLSKNLLGLVATRNRHALLPEVPTAFGQLLDAHEGRERGLLETATPADTGLREKVEEMVGRARGVSVKLETQVVPELLGGVRLTVGGTSLDGSLQGRLERMARRLENADLDAGAQAEQ